MMPKYKVLSHQFTRGDVGDVVDLDDVPGLNVRALIKSRHIELVPDEPKRKTKPKKEEAD